MDIVKNIIDIRKNKGINQQVIADALNIDISAISNIEKGKRELKVSELAKIANALDVDVIYLFTYPEKYSPNGKSDSTKVLVEIDVNSDELLRLGLKDKVLQVLNKY
jgi:transcriptional regulator with XRE-family HTH domain